MPENGTAPLRVGIGGPVGSGKTALTLALCQALRDKINMAVVTNYIYTAKDAKFLVRHAALDSPRIIGVETDGCPHTAIREDASINLEAIDRLQRAFPDVELILVESGGDLLARAFRPRALRHRRRGRRENPAQGLPRHHEVGPAGHQQD